MSGPAHGVLTLNADGSFTYQPDANYSGPDSFVYRASDGTLQSGDTSVTLDVTAVADPPTAGADGYTIAEDTLLTVTAPGVLGNDADPDAATTLSAVLVSGPAHGVLTLNADGSFTYQPDANYSGPDSFVYRASDGTLQSGDTSVTLDVTAVADPPTAGADGYTIAEDTLLTVTAPGVLGNDADPDAATTAERRARERPGPRHADAERRRQLHLPAGRQLQRAGQLRLSRQRRHAAERRHQRHPRRHRGRGSADGRRRRLHDRRRHAADGDRARRPRQRRRPGRRDDR